MFGPASAGPASDIQVIGEAVRGLPADLKTAYSEAAWNNKHGDASCDMPTILRASSFVFYFYSEEGGEPPHVHADKGDGTVKFWLLSLRVAGSEGLKPAELKLAMELVEKNKDYLLEKWHEFFKCKS